MAVSKRTRYEVLRRDGHSCRYCGNTAADSPLTIDHVIPVALGGSDAPENLVAACRDCNAGKSSTSPDAEAVDTAAEDAARWSAAMREVLRKSGEETAARAEYIAEFWRGLSVYSHGKFNATDILPDDWRTTITNWYAIPVPMEILHNAIDVAITNPKLRSTSSIWRYFCGVVWRTLDKAREEVAEDLHSADDDEGEPSAEEFAAWDRAFNAAEKYGRDAVYERHTAGIASGLILQHVIDGLHRIPDELKWSA